MKRIVSTVMAALALPSSAYASPVPSQVDDIPVVLLLDTGAGQVLYARQPELRFVPASMTKVMTAFVAFREMTENRLRADREFMVSAETARIWRGKGTSLDLAPGARISTDTLLHGIATVSANDASVVLAEGYAGSIPAWSALMNEAAGELGMKDSRFATPNGWPDNGATYVSAYDLARLAQAMIARYPDLYHRYFGQKHMVWNGRVLRSHDPTIGIVPGADGIKTGFTREAGFNFLGSAKRDGRRLVMVVAGARSEAQRAAASRALLEWGFAGWTRRGIFAPAALIGEAKVQGGSDHSVPLYAAGPIYVVLPRGGNPLITLRIRYNGPLIAPIDKGDTVAELEVSVDGKPNGRTPLFAAKSIDKSNIIERLLNGLRWFVG